MNGGMKNVVYASERVDVVRCGECVHQVIFNADGFEFPDTICPLYDREGYLDERTYRDDWFCADGERRYAADDHD